MDFKQIALNYEKEILNNLSNFVKIDSVYCQKISGEKKPFGKGVAMALEYMAKLAESDGFSVDRCDGYVTEITYGDGKEMILIAAHADVVPYSDDWDALSGKIEDGLIYGRGTQDDKGPAIVCYYVLKAIKDLNIKLNKKIRLVIGGNEETGSQCLKYYFEVLKKPQPDYAFTPDADFPLIYGEKGIANVKISGKLKLSELISLKSGNAFNSVPDVSEFLIRKGAIDDQDLNCFLNLYKLQGRIENFNKMSDKITINGKASHGATPMNGINALVYSLKFLSNHLLITELGKYAYFFEDYYGKNLLIDSVGKELKELTMNLGVGKITQTTYEFYLNIRYPENTDAEKIKNKIIDTLAQLNPKVELLSNSKPLLIDPNSKMVKTFLAAYQEITGDMESKIMTIGGGTYARQIKNCLAFGMQFKNTPNKMHQKDESIPTKDLLDGFAIYLKAILDLNEN